MKNLIIALMVFAVTLGVSCKKDNAQPGNDSQKQKEVVLKVEKGVSLVDPTHPPETQGGQGTFPHNTGVCNCGRYSVCHPAYYSLSWYDSNGFGHYEVYDVRYGQTSFPAGAVFSPARP
jgi:hypothetical protein